MLEYVAMGGAVILIAFALSVYSLWYKKNQKGATSQKAPAKGASHCPMCGSALAAGENIYTRVYGPMTDHDQRCTIVGCPYCYPICKPGIKRTCPVCGQSVPMKGYLNARLFNRTEGKKHVMVTGCTECYKKNKNK
ncbi:MAG: hypothetical protein K6E51_10675 [Treponema sp.]|nr:hypothetical protein [Treponema sp.]